MTIIYSTIFFLSEMEQNDNDLALIGIWKKQFVFKLFAPENVEYIVLPDDTVLTDCFLCDSNTAEVKYIK